MTDTPDNSTNTNTNANANPSIPHHASPPPPPLRWAIALAAVLVGGLIVGVFLGPPVTAAAKKMFAADASKKHDDKTWYTCSMHPWVILPDPGPCPVCGMDLVPIDPSKLTGELDINPATVQNIGVATQPVTQGPLVKTIRTVGNIDYDETRVRDINTKVTGWIDKLFVDYVGSPVKAGQPLFTLYSPDLYSAQEEYLLAQRNHDRIKDGALPEAAAGAKQMLDAAKTKLEFYDITADQIAALKTSGKPEKNMTIVSPYAGVVIAKHANEGMNVTPGMQVYRIADLSKVWVMVTLYEYQLPFVSVGQKAVMTLPYIPGQRFEGKVIYVYPYLDSRARQVQVRLEFDNPHDLLKPGMFANVELSGTLAKQVTLAPRSAIIDTGRRQVAFVSKGKGKFEPRDVQLGPETDDDRVQILDGLKPGESVVTSAQFLLDSEANMRAALAKMILGKSAPSQATAIDKGESPKLTPLPDASTAKLTDLLHAYITIGNTLAADKTDGIAPPARRIAADVNALLNIPIPEAEHFWHQHDEAATIRGQALAMIDAADLPAARLDYANLSVALIKLMHATGVPAGFGESVEQLHCPMYHEGQGGAMWLQPVGEARNPFFGSKMLGCFDKRETLPAAPAASTAKPTDTADDKGASHDREAH